MLRLDVAPECSKKGVRSSTCRVPRHGVGVHDVGTMTRIQATLRLHNLELANTAAVPLLPVQGRCVLPYIHIQSLLLTAARIRSSHNHHGRLRASTSKSPHLPELRHCSSSSPLMQGPPPPKVPEGWKAVWNDQYHEWFFVNIYTKQSTWEKPTDPVYPPGEAPFGAPPGAPPAYGGAAASHPTGTSEKSTFSSNNPYGAQPLSSHQPGISDDEALARKLQEEEQARSGGSSNAYYGQQQPGTYGSSGPSVAGAPHSGGYPAPGGYSHEQPYQQSPSTPYQQPQQQQQYDDQSRGKTKGGILGKLLSKASSKGSSHQQPYGQQPHYGGGGYGGGYGGQGMYQQRPGFGMPGGGGRRPGGGMGAGGLAMGAGAGLLGGAMLGSAMADDGDTYVENNYGDDDGGGGGFDDGGGDFGGDF